MRASGRPGRHRTRRGRALRAALVMVVVASGLGTASPAGAQDGGTSDRPILGIWEVQSLNGANNNRSNPTWGMVDTIYPRVGPAHYVDGRSVPFEGPNPRYVSNRIFNDTNQNLYSQRNVSQWAFVWGQFVDHTIAQRLGRRMVTEPGEPANIVMDNSDPMESFPSAFGIIPFDRSRPAPDTGETNPRDQINTLNSYLDAETVYGNTDDRLDWLRAGTVDGNPDNNQAALLLADGYLPRRDGRGDPATSPNMVAGGQLINTPYKAAVAGDPRANENPALLGTHTLFAREHNRIVSQLPRWMSQQDKFQIARAVVIAEQQYITYNDFLPALGVKLPPYRGYRPNVDVSISNEFATVGFRAHSQIRGDFRLQAEVGRYSQETLDRLADMGVEVTTTGNQVNLMIPLGEDAFFNPDLLELIELGPLLEGIGQRPQNRNDEQISNMLRSFPFAVPVEGNPTCSDDPALPKCIPGVNDLGAIDIARGRDHGMPTYNDMRRAYGLPPKTSFKAITGESSEAFPADPQLTPGDEINDPDSLDFTKLYDINGKRTTPEADNATRGVRRTPVAARLKGVYGSVDNVDAFVGMMAEPHLPGRDFGELQLAIWQKQFLAMRDGDRFFYGNDPLLSFVRHAFGIDFRKNLGDVIALNTDIPRRAMASNVFLAGAAGRHHGDRAPAVEVPKVPTGPHTRAGSARAAAFEPPQRPAALWLPGTAPAVTAARSASDRNRRSRRARNRGDVNGEAAV